MKFSMLALAGLLMAGCSSVTMKEPFPDSALSMEKRNKLSGTWLLDDTVLHVAFDSNGVPSLATTDWENDRFVLSTFRPHAAKRRNTLYFSMPAEPSGTASNQIFAEIALNGDRMFVWLPDVEFFRSQIEAGKIKGTIDGSDDIVIETPAADILSLISTNSAAMDYKKPLVLNKLK